MASSSQGQQAVESLRSELNRLAKEFDGSLKQAEDALAAEQKARIQAERNYQELYNRVDWGGEERPTTPLDALREYRDDLDDEIDHYTRKANLSRRYSNILQWIIIVGSVLTAALTSAGAASSSAQAARFIAAGTSGFVSIAAGLAGFFKFRERGFNEQMTADAIEKHAQAARLGLGEYSKKEKEEDRLKLLASNIEEIKDEQRKRELQLEQKSEDRASGSSGNS